MPFDMIGGFAIPFVAALVAAILLRFSPDKWELDRHAAALPVGVAFVVGMAITHVYEFVPISHRNWILYAVVSTSLLSGLLGRQGTPAYERLVFTLVVSAWGGWHLIPEWAKLEEIRLYLFGSIIGVSTLVACSFDYVASKQKQPWLNVWYLCTLLTSIGLISIMSSFRIASLALFVLAGTLGAAVVTLWRPKQGSLAGAGLVYGFSLSAILMVAKLESFAPIPWFCYVLPVVPFPLFAALELVCAERVKRVYLNLLHGLTTIACCAGSIGISYYLAPDFFVLK